MYQQKKKLFFNQTIYLLFFNNYFSALLNLKNKFLFDYLNKDLKIIHFSINMPK